MGITLDDLNAQRAMLKRGEEKRKAARQAEERERLRDKFAAAALTELMQFRIDAATPGAYVKSTAAIAADAYDIADAMLRERERQTDPPCVETDSAPSGKRTSNHDAVPEACVQQSTREPERSLLAQSEAVERGLPRTGNTPTLTDEEREALEFAVETGRVATHDEATLRNLLERLT